VFGTGQTTLDGFEKCLEPVLKKYGDEKHVFWVNLRSVQSPVQLTSIEMFGKITIEFLVSLACRHKNLGAHNLLNQRKKLDIFNGTASRYLKG
jgi:hypothetical protein